MFGMVFIGDSGSRAADSRDQTQMLHVPGNLSVCLCNWDGQVDALLVVKMNPSEFKGDMWLYVRKSRCVTMCNHFNDRAIYCKAMSAYCVIRFIT